jgi:hypothetical protein
VTVDKELFADTLPTYLTRFVGRERELAELTALSGSRLLTILRRWRAGQDAVGDRAREVVARR